jgi:hypothetical protein
MPDKPKASSATIRAEGKCGGGDVQFGPHQDRGLARKYVAHDAAEAGGENAHADGRDRRHAEGEALGRTEGRVSGKAGGIEPEQRVSPPKPEPAWPRRRLRRRRR